MQELKIDKLVAGGLGLARDGGGVILVEGALPGETVLADVRAARGVRRGVTRDILQASLERVDSLDLPTADLSHASYPAQLRFKRGFVEEALARIAKLDFPVGETVPGPQQLGYRNAAQYLVRGENLAYRERQGHAAFKVGQDPLVIPALADFLVRLDVWKLDAARELAVRGSSETGEVLAAVIGDGQPRMFGRAVDALLDAGAAGVSLAPPAERRFARGARLLAGEPTILERYGDFDLGVSATGFAQVNPRAAGELYRAAARLAGTGTRALDLYGGAGGLGFHLARNFGEVTVLDTSAQALTRGDRDAERLGLDNVRFEQGEASNILNLNSPGADVIVVDPPRAGLGSEVRQALLDTAAARLVYVSCDPATWARDVGDLARGGWRLASVTPHDFYPQTSHVEVLSLLVR